MDAERTALHIILRYAHISAGTVGLISGVASMSLRKGSTAHQVAGKVFVVSLLVTSLAGTYITLFIRPNLGNLMGGLMAFYLTVTAWATVWRKPGETGLLEVGAMLVGLAITLTAGTFWLRAMNSASGTLGGYPPAMFFVFGSVALLATALDVRTIIGGGVTGVPRLRRHLWRMTTALFMATGSLFLGQARFFPESIRIYPLLGTLAFLPLAALVYWMWRVRRDGARFPSRTR
jgi:hypothetical protein